MEKKTITRRTQITVETERLLIIKPPRIITESWCVDCEAQVTRVTPEVAATLMNLSRRTIYRALETNQLHFTESADGWVAVCLNSLLTFKLNCEPANSGFTAITITQPEKTL